jgi:DNA-binding SARP family transcriptional activator/predicted negative regulator of RcsB-dependent stress response
MIPDLRILLLGPPLICRGDQRLALNRRRLRALLFYLACQTREQTRGQLGLLFWNETTDEKVRKSLREDFSRLRGELNIADLFLNTREFVILNPQRASSDVREFLDLYAQAANFFARIPATNPLPESVRDLCRNALNLWRAPHFVPLEDFSLTPDLEHWAAALAGELNTARKHLLERLADHEALLARFDPAVAHLRAVLEIDPFDDRINLHLWTLLERAGRIAEAAAVSRTTLDFYTRSDQDIPLEMEAASARLHAQSGQATGESSVHPARRILLLPLVGRGDELSALHEAYQRRKIVLLFAEAGGGKTRLLEEFSRLKRSQAQVVSVTARPGQEAKPLQTITEVLRGALTLDDWRGLSRSWINALYLLLPELEALFPDANPPETPSGLNQPILFEAVNQALLKASERQPLILLVDNMQNCDETSLAALHDLVEKDFFHHRAFLVLAMRGEEIRPETDRLLRHLANKDDCTTIKLPPLNATSMSEILQLVFNRQPPAEMSSRLERETGGNPFLLIETIRAMLEYSADPFDTIVLERLLDRLPVTVTMRNLARDRMDHLSERALGFLQLAAVTGSEFTPDLIEQAGRYTPEETIRFMEELEHAQLVQLSPDDAQTKTAAHPLNQLSPSAAKIVYRFVHQRFREIILSELSPLRKRLYHRQIAEALKAQETGRPGTQAILLAKHYQQAGDDKQTFTAWLAAARYAGRLYSYAEQENAYLQAEAIIDQTEMVIETLDMLELYSGWIEMGFTRSNAAITRRASEALLRQGWRRENHQMLCTGFLGLAAACELSENGLEGLGYLEQARPFLPAGNLYTHLAYHYFRGGLLILSGRLDEAVGDLSDALNLAAEGGSHPTAVEQRAACGHRLANVLLLNGWPARAIVIADQAMADSRAVMSHSSGARSIALQAVINIYLTNFQLAEAQNRMALRMAQSMQNSRLVGQIHIYQSEQALLQGHFDLSWREMELALETGRNANFSLIAAQAWRLRGDILRALGVRDEAMAAYTQAVEIGGSTLGGMDALYRLGLLRVITGNSSQGLSDIRRAIQTAGEAGLNIAMLQAKGALALAYAHLKNNAEVNRLVEEVATEGARREWPYLRSSVFMPLSWLALNENRLSDARQKGLALAQFGRSIGSPIIELNGLYIALRVDREQPETISRYHELLDSLDRSTQEPSLRPWMEQMQSTFRALFD